MKTPFVMSPAELSRAIEKHNALSMALCDEFIAAGRGFETPNETRKLSDPLALRWREQTNRAAELHAEKDRRMTYHGSLKRVPTLAPYSV